MDPLVSVLMTAYNREKYIAEAIESVLASTYTNFELIIVDDGSKDNTVSIAKSFEAKDNRIKVYVNDKNLGDYPNRNKAAEYANGKYIKYLDSDDIIYPHGLEVMVSSMEKFPKAGFGLASKPDDNKPFPIFLLPEKTYWEHFNGYSHFDRAPGSSIIKLESFKKIGGFSGRQYVGDQELWLIFSRNFPMVKFQFDLYWNRIHENQQIKLEIKVRKTVLKIRKEILRNAVLHAECPLQKKERKNAIFKIQHPFRYKLKRKLNSFIS